MHVSAPQGGEEPDLGMSAVNGACRVDDRRR